MITFTATAQFTEQQVKDFAIENGWQDITNEEVISSLTEEELAGLPTAIEFVNTFIKKELMNVLGRPTKQAISNQVKEQERLQIEQYQQELEQSITLEHD